VIRTRFGTGEALGKMACVPKAKHHVVDVCFCRYASVVAERVGVTVSNPSLSSGREIVR